MKENGIQYGKITVTGAAGRRGKEQGMKENGVIQEYTGSLSRQIREEYHIGEEYYHGEIKRGLRNSDGTGVMVGVTKVGSVQGYLLQDGQRIPIPGRLYYRGIELNDIVEAHRAEGTFGFEEVAYLLLMGYLPSQGELRHFNEIMNRARKLPEGFTEGMIMRRTSGNIMNELGRSILSLYSYDPDPDDLSVDNLLRQSVELIGYFPSIVANAYAVKRHHFGGESLHIHYPEEGLSTAENFLRMIRPDKSYTEEEAHLLDKMCIRDRCDSIIMGQAHIESIPAITANCPDAQLIHEAAIGKIAGDQLLKLETLGLSPEEAEETILKGFLA